LSDLHLLQIILTKNILMQMRTHAAIHKRRRSSVHTHDIVRMICFFLCRNYPSQRNLSFGVDNKEELVSTGEKPPEIKTEKKPHKRLNATQLEDLFRRLDINNDNELDFEEFLIVIQKLDVGSKTRELDKDFLSK
jgi:hypothetical protein